MNEKVRAWWWARQGLDGSLRGQTAEVALTRCGWSRSVGGANPYITVHSRTGASMASIDEAVAKAEIHELPSARGCTYVVPKEQYGLALTVAQGFGTDAEIALAKRHLGVTDAEVDRLCDAVLAALKSEALDPKALKAVVGDAARSLGDDGKKRGIGTTLPLALGRLQVEGRIRRIPAESRLDRQRYKYVAWNPSPRDAYKKSRDEALVDLARSYWQWTGPASIAHFQWFAGLGVKAAKTATEPLGLVPLEPGCDLLIAPAGLDAFHSFQAPKDPRFNLVASLDGIVLLRRDIVSLLDDSDLDRRTATDKALVQIGSIADLYCNAILDRGRLVGFWEFDPEARDVVWTSWVGRPQALKAEVAEMERFIRDELEDCRSFSLDSPESRRPKLALLKQLAKGEA